MFLVISENHRYDQIIGNPNAPILNALAADYARIRHARVRRGEADVADNWLVAQGDKFIGETVTKITSSPAWKIGNNAVVLTWDEGDTPTDTVVTIVVTNHGPRGVQDATPYSHYSLLASLQQRSASGACSTAAPTRR